MLSKILRFFEAQRTDNPSVDAVVDIILHESEYEYSTENPSVD